MKQYWTKIELEKSWSLSPSELSYIEKKDNKLVYALKMKYFDVQGYFPKKGEDIPKAAIEYVAAQLSLPNQSSTQTHIKSYHWQSRTSQLHNTEIREYYGFKKFEPSDLSVVKEFIETELLPQGLSIGQVRDDVYKFLKKNTIDPFAQHELNKQISTICLQYEKRFFTQCSEHLSLDNQQNLLKLLEMYDDDQTILNFIRTSAGKMSSTTIHEEQEKLSYIKAAGVIDQEFFHTIPRKFLKVHHDKVAISTPSQLLEINSRDQRKFLGLLTCFAKYKGAKILDSLIEVLVKKVKKLEQFGKEKLKEELWEYYTREDKDELLDNLVDVSLAHPDGIIKEKIYPEVGGKEKLEQSKLSRQSFKQARRESEYKHIRSLYVQGYRKDIFFILNALKLHPNHSQAILEAINFILDHQKGEAFKGEYYPLNCVVPTENLISSLDLKVITNADGKINRLYYEIALLKLLRRELRCKNIWGQGAFKYADPEKDLPQDFKKNKSQHCQMLNLSEDPH